MAVNLVKLAVGIEDVGHLQEVQDRRLKVDGQGVRKRPRLLHVTRNKPRRLAELVESGSIYWVIKGFIRARQRILGAVDNVEGEMRAGCGLILDATLVQTQIISWKPFQGWRYLELDNAPIDVDSNSPEVELPAEMAAELRNLGLL
jgi:hypothetical protein